MTNELLFICGGAWTGKTARAASLAQSYENVVWIGTSSESIPALQERVAALRASRPRHWQHISSPFHLTENLNSAIEGLDKKSGAPLVVIDSVSQWISNEIAKGSARYDEQQLLATVQRDIEDFCALISSVSTRRPMLIVSSDFGQSIPPEDAASRTLRMMTGLANTRLAASAHRAEAMLAGMVIYQKTRQ